MPLTFDLSFDELKTYQGRNPCPQDFDQFWEKSLEEMRAVDPQVKLEPSDFQAPYAECYNMYFTGVGNARVHAKLIKPKNVNKPQPAVLQFHGYSASSGDWILMLPYAAMGYTVAALDCRGQGGLSEDVGGVVGWTLRGHIVRGLDGPPEKLLFRHIFLDAAQMAAIVMNMPDVDENRVGAMGSSQGGGLTLACSALEPRIKLAAPVFPFLCDYKRVWEMDLAENAYLELSEYFRRFDPLHEKEDAVFEKLGYVDVQNLCPRIKAEVFMGVGLMDKICPPSTQFAAYNKIVAKKSLAVFHDYGHERLPGHYDRVFEYFKQL